MTSTTCCGCTSLKTGVLVITILLLFIGIYYLTTESFQQQRLTFTLVYIISIVISIMAIHGTVNENAYLIFPFISTLFVGLFIALPIIFIRTSHHYFKGYNPNNNYTLTMMSIIFGFGIGVYLFITVCRFYHESLRKNFLASSNIDTTANIAYKIKRKYKPSSIKLKKQDDNDGDRDSPSGNIMKSSMHAATSNLLPEKSG
ncbi:hypothetical protein PV327_002920 [Microctonus hyperodae]|uniref:Uncharacterized protein n=1 Tax=Microctonus hyperodae TaxID=165561 RepID=A0AA39L0L5_MICHY|nr:hypothetical protein PV327_002920 [Microctonus hyperodae]